MRELPNDVLLEEERGELFNLDCLPSCTRICINLILLPKSVQNLSKEGKPIETEVEQDYNQEKVTGYILGSCQISIFDENFLVRQGKRELRLWPFESFIPRMVCQGECFRKQSELQVNCQNTIHKNMSLLIEFQTYMGKVGWRLTSMSKKRRMKRRIHKGKDMDIRSATGFASKENPTGNYGPIVPTTVNLNNQNENSYSLKHQTESLRQVKQLVDAYPMDIDE